MPIKHLCIPGGGPNGIISLGALQKLEQHGFWKIEDIESIYATSVGTIISLLIALKFDWDFISEYIMHRPWHESYTLKATNILDSYNKKGLFDRDIFEMFFKPFFDARDIPLTMTMKEFFEYSKIEMHFFSVDINKYKIHDISYITFPDIPVLQAVHMSCCIPALFCPVIIEDKCFIDGGLISNYPIQYCIDKNPKNTEEILGIHNFYKEPPGSESESNNINNDSNIVDFMILFITNLIRKSNINEKCVGLIPNELSICVQNMDFSFRCFIITV